jgi:hypothetical protein
VTTVIAHDDRVSWLPVVGVGCVSAYLVGFTWAMGHAEYDVWGAFLVLPVLALLSAPLVRRAARTEDDPAFGQLVVLALTTKLLGSLALYALDQQLYAGSVDAEGYSGAGAVVAHQLHHGEWHQQGSLWGTPFVVLLTGLLFYVTGPTSLGGFLVFSWLGFWGLFLFYRAFRIAVPQGDARRYALLLFFLPSLVFWSSSIGKEPWMTLSLGICAYGSARLLTDRRGGLLLIALGITMAAAVRPHIAPIPLLAITMGYLVRSRRSARPGPLRPLVKVMGLAVLICGSVLAVSQAKHYLDLKSVDGQSIQAVVAESEKRTTDGGSSFNGRAVTTPLDFPQAFVTVLFRPFPTEAHNAQALAGAAEGTVLLMIFLSSGPRLAQGLRQLRHKPYLAVALATTCLFVYALSGYSNFGLLVRQRVQVLPFLMVLLALPRPARR